MLPRRVSATSYAAKFVLNSYAVLPEASAMLDMLIAAFFTIARESTTL